MAVVPMPAFPSLRPVAAFSDRLLAYDLPGLPSAQRAEVVAFVGRRVARLPSPMRLGVGIVATLVDGVGRLVGADRLARFVGQHPLPVLGEYARLVRSLAFAYVWDTWPATAPDGTPLTDPEPR
jgi:hypothetical protein